MTKILVIEDEQPLLEEILDILGFEGYETISADNGLDGVQLAKEHLPDLIVSDIMMPKMDGYAALVSLRSNPTTAMIPFIFMTAKAERQDMRKGMEYGASDYLTKPFATDELLGAVRARLAEQKIIAQHQEQRLEGLRSTIIRTLPHEMRTPLSGIIGCGHLLLMDPDGLSPKHVREMAEIIVRSGERLHRLIENYLLYAQIKAMENDTEKIQLLREKQTSHPGDRIVKAAKDVAIRVAREDDLLWEAENTPIQIADENLGKITEELVDNAFKFSEDGTEVRVTAATNDDTFVLCVSDSGRGMSAEQVNSVDACVQFDRELYEQQGSGMGLIIAKRLAELYGGILTIDSIFEQGTMVRVELPVANAH
jgi:two-component system, sensor histidine kinase and response regulator